VGSAPKSSSKVLTLAYGYHLELLTMQPACAPLIWEDQSASSC